MWVGGATFAPTKTQTAHFKMTTHKLREGSLTAQFCRTVVTNTLKGLTIEQLASECGQSPTKFKKEFKEVFGDTPHHWAVRRRLEFAQRLLEYTNLPVKIVAQQAGFSTTSHFIRLFKAEYGHTPTHQRKLYGRGDTKRSCDSNCGFCNATSGVCCCNNIRNGQCPHHHNP